MVEVIPRMDTLAQDIESIQSQGDNPIALMENSRRQKQEQLSAERKTPMESESPSKKHYSTPRKKQNIKKVWRRVGKELTPSKMDSSPM
jgi:hypothetical protein